MSPARPPRVITKKETKVERFPWGPLEWICRPDILDTRELLLVRVNIARGKGQSFHRQPSMEEVIYVLEGKAEIWLGEEPRTIGPGETVHVPMDAVHATFNVGSRTLRFLSIFAPARFKGPALVDLSEREPWKSLAAGRGAPGRPRNGQAKAASKSIERRKSSKRGPGKKRARDPVKGRAKSPAK